VDNLLHSFGFNNDLSLDIGELVANVFSQLVPKYVLPKTRHKICQFGSVLTLFSTVSYILKPQLFQTFGTEQFSLHLRSMLCFRIF